jgi:hypothetical protein
VCAAHQPQRTGLKWDAVFRESVVMVAAAAGLRHSRAPKTVRGESLRPKTDVHRHHEPPIPRLPSWSAVASLRDTAFARCCRSGSTITPRPKAVSSAARGCNRTPRPCGTSPTTRFLVSFKTKHRISLRRSMFDVENSSHEEYS